MSLGGFAAQEDDVERCERDFLSVVLEEDPQWPPLKGRNGHQPKRCRGLSQLGVGEGLPPPLLQSELTVITFNTQPHLFSLSLFHRVRSNTLR